MWHQMNGWPIYNGTHSDENVTSWSWRDQTLPQNPVEFYMIIDYDFCIYIHGTHCGVINIE